MYVDRKNSTYYQLMYKSSYGYLKIEAVLDAAGKITINRLIITGYTDNDFSNCSQYSLAGKCLSCDRESEIEFQGACFKKLEGCIIQAANVCVKCNVDFVKSASKCVKDCSAFFKWTGCSVIFIIIRLYYHSLWWHMTYIMKVLKLLGRLIGALGRTASAHKKKIIALAILVIGYQIVRRKIKSENVISVVMFFFKLWSKVMELLPTSDYANFRQIEPFQCA